VKKVVEVAVLIAIPSSHLPYQNIRSCSACEKKIFIYLFDHRLKQGALTASAFFIFSFTVLILFIYLNFS
jgi:hypothetical protein